MEQQELFSQGTKLTGRDPHKRCDSLFYALMPDPRSARHLVTLARTAISTPGLVINPLQWSFLEAGRLHLSLPLVREQRELEPKFLWLARQVAQRVVSPAFELTLDTMGTFPATPTREDHRPFILLADNPALRELIEKLGVEMCRMGMPAYIDFDPHLTLAYGPEAIPWQRVAPIKLLFTEFVLIKSEKGAHYYDICGRWPLIGG